MELPDQWFPTWDVSSLGDMYDIPSGVVGQMEN